MLNALFLGKKELPPRDVEGAERPSEPSARVGVDAVEPQFPDIPHEPGGAQ